MSRCWRCRHSPSQRPPAAPCGRLRGPANPERSPGRLSHITFPQHTPSRLPPPFPPGLLQLLRAREAAARGRGRLLGVDNFIDSTNIDGRFDFSEWVRAYGKYLDEQVCALEG
jgi:hypothetical protein